MAEREIQERILKYYARAIVHMRSQLKRKRFGLFFGAGVCKPYKLPNWGELVQRIAKDPQVKGEKMLEKLGKQSSHSSVTQVLFQHFRDRCRREMKNRELSEIDCEREVKRRWMRIIHANLYKNAELPDKLMAKHPYMKEFIKIIRHINLTINYNFDDVIEKMLLESRTEEEKKEIGRPYEVVWDTRQQFSGDKNVIYHPNGFLPHNLLERPSTRLVFSEDEYADQLIETMSGHYASLLHFLSKYTCLFCGLSLTDGTLRHLLRQSAQLNPGHYHYYISFRGSNERRSKSREKAIVQANFCTYNLFTLFLNNKEIKALAQLINFSGNELKYMAEELGKDIVYCYYLTGPVCVGKSTTLSHFRNLNTFAEWFDERPPILGERADKLSPEQKRKADKWIAEQFSMKNRLLLDQTEGIFLVDRCPLDPVSFTDGSEWTQKADALRKAIARGKARKKIRKGHVVLLLGDKTELAARALDVHKNAPEDYVAEMQKKLLTIYRDTRVSSIDASKRSLNDLVHRIAVIIHLEDYKEVDLQDRLVKISQGKIKWK